MKEVTVFDSKHVMLDNDGPSGALTTLDWLDELLNGYGVEHSFSLPCDADFRKHPTAKAVLYYKDKDDMLFNLIYALYCKVHRSLDDKTISEALAKIADRYLNKEAAPEANDEGGAA